MFAKDLSLHQAFGGIGQLVNGFELLRIGDRQGGEPADPGDTQRTEWIARISEAFDHVVTRGPNPALIAGFQECLDEVVAERKATWFLVHGPGQGLRGQRAL